MTEYKTICEIAARTGGAVLLDWRGRFRVREKGPADLVTEADLASQNAISELIWSRYPDHDILGEEDALETRPRRSSEFRWIIDPLDGTTNYVHGLQNYSVSVALEHCDQVVAGAVFDPVTDECFSAAVGQGAWLADEPLRASGVTEVSEALVAISLAARIRRDAPEVRDLIAILHASQAMRRLGSAALNLCYLAAGRLDGYVSRNTKIWDIAAGSLLVREAGALMTAPDGEPLDLSIAHFIAASTPQLHAQLVALLRDA